LTLPSEESRSERDACRSMMNALVRDGWAAGGPIAFEGQRAGGDVFTSFDRVAVALIAVTGGGTRLLSG
jgi:hypothetical protein